MAEGTQNSRSLQRGPRRNGVDLIATRNKRDFACSPVPALTPREFVAAFKPVGYDYELIES